MTCRPHPPPRPPPSQKVVKLSFSKQQMHNVMNRMQKQFFDYFYCLVQQNFYFMFLGLRFFDKKMRFATISIKLGYEYVSEDSKTMKKMS